MSEYAFNPDTLNRTTQLLYDHIPEFYKTRDRLAQNAANPFQKQDLRELTEILAVPLAAMRQSIEEMFADFFVDTAGEDVLALLAENIAIDLIFKNPDANRRDLRQAVFRRRHKGKPGLLTELANTLSDRLVAFQEGWKHVQLCQDLNILRLERKTPDLRARSNQHLASGPTTTIAKTVDFRSIAEKAGTIHPRHVAYWTSISQFYPVTQATPVKQVDGDSDIRFAFDPNDDWRQLRARATSTDDTLKSDKILEGFFDENPGDWLHKDGRCGVQIAGLPAGTIGQATSRNSVRVPADVGLIKGTVQIEVIQSNQTDFSSKMDFEVHGVKLGAGDLPNATQTSRRRKITLSLSDIMDTPSTTGNLSGTRIPMLKISPQNAVQGHMGATTLLISSNRQNSIVSTKDPELANSGYLSGALYVQIPAMHIKGDCWYYIAADGSLHRAYETMGVHTIDIPLINEGGDLFIPPRLEISQPVGPVWPKAPETQEQRPFSPPLPSMFAPPVLMHGLNVLRSAANIHTRDATRSAIVFALLFQDIGGQVFEPILRLTWKGGDPYSTDPAKAAVWQVVNSAGKVTLGGKSITLEQRFSDLAAIIEKQPNGMALAYRFESQGINTVLTPGEIAFTSVSGDSVLIHVPQLVANAPNIAEWPRGHSPIRANSIALQVGRDGSSWVAGSNICKRKSLGTTAPIQNSKSYRCHDIHWRRLCAWQNETATDKLDPTQPNRIDVDPASGLFAFSKLTQPQDYHKLQVTPSPGPEFMPPEHSVTATLQRGATMAIGSVPVDRSRILNETPLQPTRIVSKTGILPDGIDSAKIAGRVYTSLSEAFKDIANDPADHEVIRIEDSATYKEGTLLWPKDPIRLSIIAAENESPLIKIAGSNPNASEYETLFLSGLGIGSEQNGLQPTTSLILPRAQFTRLTFVTVFDEEIRIEPTVLEASGEERISIEYCAISQLKVVDSVNLYISDSIIDSDYQGIKLSIDAVGAVLSMDRTTLIGPASIEEAHISDSIIFHPLHVREQFKGCIRFSALAPGGQTPRKFRVIRHHPDLGIPIKPLFVSLDRRSPAYLRLRDNANPFLETAASNLGEVGAFNKAEIKETLKGMTHRIKEHTPAGLISGVIRQE